MVTIITKVQGAMKYLEETTKTIKSQTTIPTNTLSGIFLLFPNTL